jgi:LPS export ABC transporter protein LptC
MGRTLPLFWQSFLIIFLIFFSVACSFDYGASASEDDGQPDIVMQDVQYVRVRDGTPIVRFEAQGAERYEKRQTMELKNFSFEQFNAQGDDVNAVGSAENASVELESGNVHLKGGVKLEVDSEDITIKTMTLDWQDKERRLAAGTGEPVDILRSVGTNFTGWGFIADARRRTWTFSDGVKGTYIEEDDDEGDEEAAAASADAETPVDGSAEALAGDTGLPAAAGTLPTVPERPAAPGAPASPGSKAPPAAPVIPPLEDLIK